MFRTKRRILWKLRRIQKRRQQATAGVKEKKLFLCYPFGEREFKIAHYVFTDFITQYHDYCRVLLYESFYPLVKSPPPEILIPLRKIDMNNHGFPSKHPDAEIFSHAFWAACDLNPDFNPTSLYCIARSFTPNKIGFQFEHSDYFFNLRIDKNRENGIELGYWHIRNILESSILAKQIALIPETNIE